ncbi:hypothetical protein K469DRAFT_673912 [Zopfia rhizophila CBS 207.26]|uniref:Uncharacterized protein n=1 Tax=Zopfia rhizophila CBS 207.26 TaxID=1314779 RepID=A0A6A6DMP4_9PEZI|nr:hypothetical protein K469DRAFT_673912 [Zopfia rhizophila CBS 207.26]
MATQTLPSEITDSVRSFVVPRNFSIQAVDGRRAGPQTDQPQGQKPLSLADIPKVPPPPTLETHPNDNPDNLGPVLGKFVGTFQGAGMNTIFRPRNGFTKGNLNEDNLLEVNLTVETLQFMESSVLNKVPNRGFDDQVDIDLTGVPYQQTVSDQLNTTTGKADLGKKTIDLHFEQGLFMRIPQTGSKPGGPNPITPPIISRMGSIPHGTTINAQDFEPQAVKNGKPKFPPADITPTFIVDIPGTTVKKGDKQPFRNMQPDDLRKPSNLQKFDSQKTITLASLNNPNLFLQNINATKDIANHWEFTVATKHGKLAGGGVANIAFLVDGVKPTVPGGTRGNATAFDMKCTYWVSTVKHDVLIKPDDYTKRDPILFPTDAQDGVPSPQFLIKLGRKTTQDNIIQVTSTQIQYSQNVSLDFGPLRWPHISVATLVPALPILVPANDPKLAKVK